MPIAESLFNRKLNRGRGVVENAFNILKQTFRELLLKSDLQVIFMPDVIFCCALLHNILLGQTNKEVERLLQVLRIEGLSREDVPEDVELAVEVEPVSDDVALARGIAKQCDLGVHMALQRNAQP